MSGPVDRREFLARATSGAAAMGVPAGRVSAQAPAEPAAMFVSLPLWAVARNVPWPDHARLAARVGYRGIDWAFGPARQGRKRSGGPSCRSGSRPPPA